MSDWDIDFDAITAAAIVEEHLQRIADVALRGIEVISCEALVLANLHPGPERIDTWVVRDAVFVVGGSQAAEYQRYCCHVLNAVITIGRVGQRTALVDDPNAGFLGFDDDSFNVIDAITDSLVQRHARFDRGLRMELGRERNLEQHIFHDVAAEWPLELEHPAIEQHVVEPPGLRA